MPQRYDTPNQARFLTWSCFRNLALFGTPELRSHFIETLGEARDDLGFELYAWVVMTNHVHVVLRPDVLRHSMVDVLRAIKAPFSRRVLTRWRQLEAPILPKLVGPGGRSYVWQRGGGYDRNVRDREELDNAMRYVHENPVRGGLTARPEDWAWSSASWYAERRVSVIEPDAVPW